MPGVSQPCITAVNNIGLTAVQVIGANPSRKKISFHNPGTNDIIVFPTLVWVAGAPTVLAPGSTLALGGGYRVFANGGDRIIDDPYTAFFAWLAQAVLGTNNPLTIKESSGA